MEIHSYVSTKFCYVQDSYHTGPGGGSDPVAAVPPGFVSGSWYSRLACWVDLFDPVLQLRCRYRSAARQAPSWFVGGAHERVQAQFKTGHDVSPAVCGLTCLADRNAT